jgi:hypothetical protein
MNLGENAQAPGGLGGRMVRPAPARFYGSLSDEQKAHFNVMARNQ